MRKVVGIIYSANSKILRRLVVPLPGELLNLDAHIGPGEAGMQYDASADDAGLASDETLQAVVAAHCGIDSAKIPNAQCAVVSPDTYLVGQIIRADPEIDVHPDGSVCALQDASVNDKIVEGVVLHRFAVLSDTDVVCGFIWDETLPVELEGLVRRDVSSEVGDVVVFVVEGTV